MSERDITLEEAQYLEYLASLKESDPRLYEDLIRAEAEDQERQAHIEHLQQLFEQDPNAGDHEWIVRATLGVPEDEG